MGMCATLVASLTSHPDLAVSSALVLSRARCMKSAAARNNGSTFDQALWDQQSPALWAYFNEIETLPLAQRRNLPQGRIRTRQSLCQQRSGFQHDSTTSLAQVAGSPMDACPKLRAPSSSTTT
ncbi:MAG: hypothetical protein MZV64_15430 [Ignavibacteriales bacterium]|nr:hypothetical protein [Ignavibacteriales bacterium]